MVIGAYQPPDDEKLMRPPAKAPCSECPWRRDAEPGWLGPHTPEEWAAMAHADGQIACHLTIPSDTPEDGSDLDEMTACAGAAIFRANVCKSPRSLRGIPEQHLRADRQRVFSWDNEFIEYHAEAAARRLAMREKARARSQARRDGWWNMICWNGLSADQQETLIVTGTLEIGYFPEGECVNPATVAIETEDDVAPGPRFYCKPCAIEYLS